MWYRKILAYREIKDPKGEKSIHKHLIEGGYHSPVFVMKPGDEDISKSLGTGSKAFGPGHYTSQNKVVAYGYDYPFVREEKLPMGTRILDYDKIDNVHGQRIVDALNQKYDKEIQINFPTDMDSLRISFNLGFNQIYPVLVELGYDAIEYKAGRNFELDVIVDKLKANPALLNPNRRNLDKDSTDFQKPKSFNRRIKKLKQQFDEKNILIINANIITNPKLFQKERFRPETLTEEEKEILEKGKYASSLDVTVKVIEYLKKTDPNWENRLKSFSCEAILNLLLAGVIDENFPFGTIYKNPIDGQKAMEFLSKGVDPSLVVAYTKDITFDDYENLKDFLEQNGKEYLVSKLIKILSYKDADTIVKLLQNNLEDLSSLKRKYFEAVKLNPENITTFDLEKLIGVGFTPDEYRYVPIQFVPQDTQRLLKLGFDKKYLLNWFAYRSGKIDFSKTGFTVEDIIENFDWQSLSSYLKLMKDLSLKNFDVKPLWEHIKQIFLSVYDHFSFHERSKYALEIIEASKNTDVSLKEIIDFTLKPYERALFIQNNFSESDELEKPENDGISDYIDRYINVRYCLEKFQENIGGYNTLICRRCGSIFVNSFCINCLNLADRYNTYLPYWRLLGEFREITWTYKKYPESIELFRDFINQFDDQLGKDIEYEMSKDDPSEFIKDISYYLKRPIYLEMFSSLRSLKEKIDKNAIAPNSTTNVNDGTISQPNSNED